MKKFILLAIVATIFSTRAMALGDAPSFTAFTLNYSYQDVHTDIPAIGTAWSSGETKLAHGFNLGFTVQQKLYKWLVLVSGLQYQFTMATEDGVNLTLFGLPYNGESRFYNHNLIVPIKFGFSMPFGGKSSFTIYGGPSLNFLVSTQMNYYYNSNNYANVDAVNGRIITKLGGDKTVTKNADFRNMGWFDIPLGVGAMLQFGRYGLRFEYEWGMVDRWKGDGNFKSDQLTAGLVITF